MNNMDFILPYWPLLYIYATMVHILKVSNIPLEMKEDGLTNILKYVKYIEVEEIIKIKIKKQKQKNKKTKTTEIIRSAYVYCEEVNKLLLRGSYVFKYNSNEYEISYYKEKEK